MSFSLQVANGDLVMSGSNLALVSGTTKMVQDLTLWVAERYAIDRFHPWMGSRLQDFIGGSIVQGTNALVYGEVIRILDNYMKVQGIGLRQAPSLYSLSELLWEINSVNVGVNFDQVGVSVNVSNAARQSTTIAVNQGT